MLSSQATRDPSPHKMFVHFIGVWEISQAENFLHTYMCVYVCVRLFYCIQSDLSYLSEVDSEFRQDRGITKHRIDVR